MQRLRVSTLHQLAALSRSVTRAAPQTTQLRQIFRQTEIQALWQSGNRYRQSARQLSSEASPSASRMTDLSGLGPKRFYDNVSTRPEKIGSCTEHAVVLDGKIVKTPRGGMLATPILQLSTALAAEWDAQEKRIRPSSMPLTTLVSTARDIVPGTRTRVVDSVLRFLHTDAVCLRPDTPKELVDAQEKACEAVVNRLRDCDVELTITHGALSATQPDSVADWVRGCAEGLDDYSLAALESACGCAKSVAVGLAMLKCVPVEDAVAAARAEERWQTQVWGVVEGGHDLDEADLEVRLRAADMIFRFVEQDPQAFRKDSEDVATMQ